MQKNYKLLSAIESEFNTQLSFAKHMAINVAIVSLVINGRYNLNHKEKLKWSQALGSTVEELFVEPITT